MLVAVPLELLDELELELLDEPSPVICPVEAVNVILSNCAPSSRRSMRKLWLPSERLLNVVGVIEPKPLVCVLFCVFHEPESSL